MLPLHLARHTLLAYALVILDMLLGSLVPRDDKILFLSSSSALFYWLLHLSVTTGEKKALKR